MRLASFANNVCLCVMEYLLVYILGRVLFDYNGLHYATHPDSDATKCLKL